MKPMNVLWKCALGVALVALLGCADGRPADDSTKPASANPLSDPVLKKEWEDYKAKFNKKYNSVEDQEHLNLYLTNKKEVEEINAEYEKGELTWKAGINQFSDMSSDEMKKHKGLLSKPSLQS